MTFLTNERAQEIVNNFTTHPKADENADTGSYYDYMFKCGPFYVSKDHVLKLLTGGLVRGVGVDYLLSYVRTEYPNTHKILKDEMQF